MDQCNLAKKQCTPCKGSTPPLKKEEIQTFIKQLKPEWKVVEDRLIEQTILFKNFREALAFTNRLGELAEKEGHHPDIFLTYGKVVIQLWTHKIQGLTESDFIMAAKIDQMT